MIEHIQIIITRRAVRQRKPPPTPCSVSAVFARWQHYIRWRIVISGNGKESFDPIVDADVDPDHHRNLINLKSMKISGKFACNFSCNNPAD